jgi:hypothetical protein
MPKLKFVTRIGREISKIILIVLEPPCLLNLIALILGGSIKLQTDFVEV